MYDENDHMEMKGALIFSVLKFDENGDVNLLQPTTLQYVFSRNRITLLYSIIAPNLLFAGCSLPWRCPTPATDIK